MMEWGHSRFTLPPAISAPKPKFLSYSLPNSASSSPRISSKKKWKDQNQASPLPFNPVDLQHSVALSRLVQLRESHLQRSKSCGEGRVSAPTDEFDLWLTKTNSIGHDNRRFTRPYETETRIDGGQSRSEIADPSDEDFKCGALCMFLPAFGKGKPVREKKQEEPEMRHIISRTVSLEKFECGSWTSSTIMHDGEESGYSSNLYFDLPLELIQCNVNDANSPVSAAFVFNKDRKGVLKTGSSRAGRKSHDSSRHVRFSTASPTPQTPSLSPCITPRLSKARDDFNAFLEAQSA